jgi:protoporphyrinogen oxidase
VLCAEIPCGVNDAIWSMSHEALGDLVRSGLERAGLPITSRVREVAVRRLPAAYPIYRVGYEEHFDRIDRWIGQLDNVLSFGRQGLYAHDNTHHALFMAQAAVNSLRDGQLDRTEWQRYRRIFDTHVVED